MHKMYDRLKGRLAKIRNWLASKPPFKQIAQLYSRAIIRSMGPLFTFAYGKSRWRNATAKTRVGNFLLNTTWIVWGVLGIVLYPVYDALSWVTRRVVKPVAQAVVLTVVMAWALLVTVFTVIFSAFVFVMSTLRHVLTMGFRWAGTRLTRGRHAAVTRTTRYASPREVLAYYLAAFLRAIAGPAHFAGKLLGHKPEWWLIATISDWSCKLHPPTFDYWFGADYPFGYEDPEQDTIGLRIIDQTLVDDEPNVSEQEKAEEFFLSSGFVLIAKEPGAPRTENDVFNSYIRERWANLNAAEIATDEWGRTWAIPKPGEPLFQERGNAASLDSGSPRMFADKELAYLEEQDPVAKSIGYGRHWAAALLDQGCALLDDETTLKRERAMLNSKLKGTEIINQHALKGFDEFVTEKRTEREGASA